MPVECATMSTFMTLHRHRNTRRNRVLMLFVLLFLSLQLLGSAKHKHDYASTESDCVACCVAHLPSGAPPVAAGVIALVLVGGLAVAPVLFRTVQPQVSFLIPHSHAPPASFPL